MRKKNFAKMIRDEQSLSALNWGMSSIDLFIEMHPGSKITEVEYVLRDERNEEDIARTDSFDEIKEKLIPIAEARFAELARERERLEKLPRCPKCGERKTQAGIAWVEEAGENRNATTRQVDRHDCDACKISFAIWDNASAARSETEE